MPYRGELGITTTTTDRVHRKPGMGRISTSPKSKDILEINGGKIMALKEIAYQIGQLVEIPVQNLFGTQHYHEYSYAETSRVDRRLREEGRGYLTRKPIVACALFADTEAGNPDCRLGIIDGNCEARRAPKFGIFKIPTAVLNLQQLTEIYRSLGEPTDESRLTITLNYYMQSTLSSFSYHIAPEKQPISSIPIPNVESIAGLRKKYGGFEKA